MKISTKQMVIGGVLLALMIASQFLKNLSVYITGPIVNLILIIATLSVGLFMGIILSIIAPITSFLITGAPIMAAIPLIIPAVMAGNIIICIAAWFFYNKLSFKGRLPVGLVVGSVCKALFMGAVIVKCLLPLFSSKLPEAKRDIMVAAASTTFSVTQLITALIGSALACVIWALAGKQLKRDAAE